MNKKPVIVLETENPTFRKMIGQLEEDIIVLSGSTGLKKKVDVINKDSSLTIILSKNYMDEGLRYTTSSSNSCLCTVFEEAAESSSLSPEYRCLNDYISVHTNIPAVRIEYYEEGNNFSDSERGVLTLKILVLTLINKLRK